MLVLVLLLKNGKALAATTLISQDATSNFLYCMKTELYIFFFLPHGCFLDLVSVLPSIFDDQ